MSPPHTYPCPYHQHKCRSSQVSGVERYGTQSSLDMTLEIRSQVKGHNRYGLKKCQGRCKIVQRIGIPSFVTIGRSVRELFSENLRAVASPSPHARVNPGTGRPITRTGKGGVIRPWCFQTKGRRATRRKKNSGLLSPSTGDWWYYFWSTVNIFTSLYQQSNLS